MANDAWIGADPPGIPGAELWQKEGTTGDTGVPSIIVPPMQADGTFYGDSDPVIAPPFDATGTFTAADVIIPLAVYPTTGDVFYFTENVGLALNAEAGEVTYLTENIGLALVPEQSEAYWFTENIGLAFWLRPVVSGWGVPMSADITDTDDWYYWYEDVTT